MKKTRAVKSRATVPLKGQQCEIFHLHFFSSKVPTLDPDSYLKFFLKFGFKFVELLQLKFDSLKLHDAAGSQISPLRHAAVSQISPLHHAARSQISPLHYAAGSQISLLHFAAGRKILLL
jgi:hypothetical protein